MGSVRRIPSIRTALRTAIQASVLVLAVGASIYLYVRLREAIVSGFNAQLVAAGSTVSAALRGYPVTDCLALAGQPDSAVQSTSEWRLLRNVQEKTGLTYAYTFLLSGDSGITYLVDGSPEGEACATGQVESLPAENIAGLKHAWVTGRSFVSRVLRFEQWGLLKVSATPIVDSSGAPTAFAGADLEVTVIRERVRTGVFIALGASIAVVLLAGLLAFHTEQRILRAIRVTTRAAIAIAAGDERELLPRSHRFPAEIDALNGQVNAWLVRMRGERDTPEGCSTAGRTLTIRWCSSSPSEASCVAIGDYVVAWRRPTGPAQLFHFGPSRGPAQLIREYLRPSQRGDSLDWKHPAGLQPFFEGMWWIHTGDGRTGSLGSNPLSWLAITQGTTAAPAEARVLTVSVEQGAHT